MSKTLHSTCVALSVVVFLVLDAAGAEPSSRPPRAVFAGSEHIRNIALTDAFDPNTRLTWRLTSGERTLASGEARITASPGGKAAATYSLRFSKPDVPWETELVEIIGDRELPRQPMWILPDDPFAQRQTWLKSLDLHLLDPVGTTTERWQAVGIPAKRLTAVDQLPVDFAGVLIVAEGMSLKRSPRLAEMLHQHAAKGAKILWLAPHDGRLPWPTEIGADIVPLRSLTLRRADVIREFDKRLDDATWPTPVGYRPVGERGRVWLEATTDAAAWPWIDMTTARGGRLIVCGYPLVSTWNDSPTPRYLFAAVLESLAKLPTSPDDAVRTTSSFGDRK